MGWETIQLWQEILEEFAEFGLVARFHQQRKETYSPDRRERDAYEVETNNLAARRRIREAKGTHGRWQRTCSVCGAQFTTTNKIKKFDRTACAVKAWWRENGKAYRLQQKRLKQERQMKKIMAVKTKAKDLAVVPRQTPVKFTEAASALNAGLGRLAQYVSGELAPPAIAQTFDVVKQAGDSIEAIEKNLKDRILKLAATVAPSTDKGSKVVDCGTYEIPLNVRKTGLNAKAFEAMLRAKSVAPVKYMTQVISYDVSEESGVKAIADGVMTPDELELCREKLAYNIMRPIKKEAKDD